MRGPHNNSLKRTKSRDGFRLCGFRVSVLHWTLCLAFGRLVSPCYALIEVKEYELFKIANFFDGKL